MKRTLLIAGIAFLVLSAVLLTTGLVQFIIPPTFQSVAKISVWPETNGTRAISIQKAVWTDGDCPPWMQTEFERLQSRVVLYQVITNLNLNQKWGEKFKEGELPTDLTYKLLRNQLEVRTTRNTRLVEIRVRSDDPTEAAAIANGITAVYREQFESRAKELRLAGAKTTEAEVQKLTGEVEVLEGKVKQLGAQLNVAGDSLPPADLEKDDPRVEFYKMKRELESLKDLRQQIIARVRQEKVESRLPWPNPIQIIDQAEPNLRPVKPHPLMKILVPAAGLLAGVLGVVLLMLAVMMKDNARKPPPLP